MPDNVKVVRTLGTVILVNPQEKKHSRLYSAAGDQESPILTTAYIMRPYIDGVKKVRIIVEEVE